MDQSAAASRASGARSITGIPGKTGIVYTLDRETGEFLWARPTVHAERDQEHRRRHRRGRPSIRRRSSRSKDETLIVCPGTQRRQELAGRRLQPADQHDVHAAAEHVHERDDHDRQARSVEARLRPRACRVHRAPGADKVGTVWAISAETGTTLWKHEQRAGMLSLVATGGGLVFGGDANGRVQGVRRRRRARCCGRRTSASPVSGYPGHVRGRRQAVRRGDDRPVARRGSSRGA